MLPILPNQHPHAISTFHNLIQIKDFNWLLLAKWALNIGILFQSHCMAATNVYSAIWVHKRTSLVVLGNKNCLFFHLVYRRFLFIIYANWSKTYIRIDMRQYCVIRRRGYVGLCHNLLWSFHTLFSHSQKCSLPISRKADYKSFEGTRYSVLFNYFNTWRFTKK